MEYRKDGEKNNIILWNTFNSAKFRSKKFQHGT